MFHLVPGDFPSSILETNASTSVRKIRLAVKYVHDGFKIGPFFRPHIIIC